MNLFKSARVILTLFYLVILVAFSLTLTISFRILFEHEYGQTTDRQRGEVRVLFQRGVFVQGPRPYSDFNDFQEDQATVLRDRLNRDLIMINLAALAIGTVLSYWFAGRTLNPIEKAHKEQARFAADASHELRTPLTNLRLENEVFLRQKSFSETDARELITSNLEEVQRLEGLSSNLLALTQYGNTSLELKPTSLKGLVATATNQVEKQAKAKHVTITSQVGSGSIIGHRDSLTELLVILLDNAVKYGPEHGAVTVTAELRDGQYLLRVQDEGPGINEADMPKIFDRLYRGDKARSSKVGGYGLGLSLAKAIADANASELRAENLPHKGACFILAVPAAKTKT